MLLTDASRAVHPHACGEYVLALAALAVGIGSPPRLWGIHAVLVDQAVTERFTPTPVGNTRSVRA